MTADQSYSKELQTDAGGSVGQEKFKLRSAGKRAIEIGPEISDVQPITKKPRTDQAFMKRHISEMNYQQEDKLCKKLDIREKILGGDFRELACHFGMTNADLTLLCQSSRPTRKLLRWAAKKPEITMRKLCEGLEKMGRNDCIDILCKNEEVDLPFMERNIGELSQLSRQELCQTLDRRIEFAEGYIDLAERLGMAVRVMKSITQNPTETILRWAARKMENTIAKLYGVLKEMKRDDCANILHQAAKRDSADV